MNKRLVWVLISLAVLCFASCKDREEKAFKREAKEVAKSISKDKSHLIGTWIKDLSGIPAMPAAMEIKNDGKLITYEDDRGILGLAPKSGKEFSWKTEGDFFIIDYGWETVTYYYQREGKSITFSDVIARNTTATYTRK